jgi:hydroxyethylthiazole kinase-like uncharacterized protein yjeF
MEMSRLENALYITEQIRLCEQNSFLEGKVSAYELMVHAGKDAFQILKSLYKGVTSLAVFCGGGNNAGDGYVIARLAHQEGLSVIVYQGKSLEDLPMPAQQAAKAAIAAGVLCHCLEDTLDTDVELIVDALLGIGLQGDVRDPIVQAINVMNESGLPIVSLDIPSGLNSDTGNVGGVAVKAATTITFIGHKVGFYTLDGPDHCGKIICCNLDLDKYLMAIKPQALLLNSTLKNSLPPRKKNSYKSMFGHVLIIGGGYGMPGAVYLAALAALKSGAGLVTVATLPGHELGIVTLAPEIMAYPIEHVNELLPLLERATVCVIGPGLGEDEWAKDLFSATLAAQLPLIIDASALKMLSQTPQYDDNWILTPHPGEAANLLGCSVPEIQFDRCNAAKLIQKKYGGCVVLKGCGTIIHSLHQDTFLCPIGNPGMASAGMGDVLSGIIGGLLAQKIPLAEAAKLGVWLHAKAGDRAAADLGMRGLLASDLVQRLPNVLNEVEKPNL